jgi:hypothetical protein
VCAREDGIRRSKDLRAEIGKFLNSTNERKKMSTKTLRKRIAVVAVSALTAGVLSVVAMPVASAATTAKVFSDDYEVATTASSTNFGICYVATQADTHTANTAATTAENAANLVEMRSSGQLKLSDNNSAAALVTAASTATDKLSFTITGPAIFAGGVPYDSGTTSLAGSIVLSNDAKTLTFGFSTTGAVPDAVYVTPTGVGTIQVTITNINTTDSETVVAKIITISSVATCGAGAYSATYSAVKAVAVGDIATQVTTSNDASGALTAANAGAVYIRYDLRDSNGADLADGITTGTVTAEVTGGLLVGAAASGTTTSAFTTGKTDYFKIEQGTADTPQAGTVTIKNNGVTVATKAVNITGPVASIETSGLDIRGMTLGDGVAGDYVVKDSAGNALAVAISGFTTLNDAQAKILTAGTTSRTPSPTSVTVPKGQFNASCSGSKGGTATGLTLKYVSSALVTITSPAFSLTCGATVFSYTASLDKASYVPGDIATLTISAKDIFGNLVYDAETLGTAGAGTEVSIAGSNMTAVVAPTNADTFTAGVKTYKYIVGSTEGTYNMVVDLDEHTSSSTGQSAITLPYSIKASTATVSNADVLKSIVALIASINKQIQALQKLILKR